MLTAGKVALRVDGVSVATAKVRHAEKGPELVVTDSHLGEFAVDDGFTLELLELVHPHEVRRRLSDGGWRKVSLRIFIALLQSGVVRVVEKSRRR